MSLILGLDTSNYTTSTALFDGTEMRQQKKLLPGRRFWKASGSSFLVCMGDAVQESNTGNGGHSSSLPATLLMT